MRLVQSTATLLKVMLFCLSFSLDDLDLRFYLLFERGDPGLLLLDLLYELFSQEKLALERFSLRKHLQDGFLGSRLVSHIGQQDLYDLVVVLDLRVQVLDHLQSY